MPVGTRSTATRAAGRASTGRRFSRTTPGGGRGASGMGRVSRLRRPPTSPSRRGIASGVRRGRKAQQQKGPLDRALSAVSGALPGKGKAKRAAKGNAGKSAGMALLAAAGGIAFAKRDKLTGMLRKGDSPQQLPPQPSHAPQ